MGEDRKIKQARRLGGEIDVAADKSVSHRAVMMGAIARGITLIDHFLMGEDCLSTVSCFRNMGVNIEINGTYVIVHGKGLRGLSEPQRPLDTGNSGTTTRLLCGLLAPQRFDSVLDGDESIRRRPMDRVIVPLTQMGGRFSGREGNFAPIQIIGSPLRGIEYTLPVASAQLKSALILAGLYAEGTTKIIEPAVSRNHTELMLAGFGGKIVCDGKNITVNGTEELYGLHVRVPADISSAAFFLVAALIVPNSEICIKNVGLNPTRTGILDVLTAMGAEMKIENRNDELEPTGDLIVKTSALHGIEVGGDLIPRLIDEIPIIAVAAAFAEGKTVIRDAAELKVKESDRIAAMTKELKKAGVEITALEDGFIIQGGKTPHAAKFDTYGDHRIAMSMTVLALAAAGESTVCNCECIGISYPQFFATLQRVMV